jgi:hypothetical protein
MLRRLDLDTPDAFMETLKFWLYDDNFGNGTEPKVKEEPRPIAGVSGCRNNGPRLRCPSPHRKVRAMQRWPQLKRDRAIADFTRPNEIVTAQAIVAPSAGMPVFDSANAAGEVIWRGRYLHARRQRHPAPGCRFRNLVRSEPRGR